MDVRSGLADLHNHLLPDVDDGTRSLDETLRYLVALAREGVTRLAVSPHLGGRLVREPAELSERLAELEAAFAAVEAACRGRSDVPALVLGQEVLLVDAATAQLVAREPRIGYRGTSYVLIEFGFHLHGDRDDVIRALVAAGRRPVVAHPERYVRDGERISVEEIGRWKRCGALLQVNGGSLIGGHGPGVEEIARSMLEEGLIDVLGTDHHGDARQVSPAAVQRRLTELGAPEQSRLLLAENPQRILDDGAVLPVPRWRSRAA